MNFPKFLFFILLLVCTFAVSVLVTYFFGINLISWEGYLFISYGAVLCFIYFTEKNLRFLDAIVTVFILSFLNAYFLKKTEIGLIIPNFLLLTIYSFSQFFLYLIAFHITWFNKKLRNFRNIFFSILASFFYVIVQFGVHTLLKRELQNEFLYRYFTNALLIMLTISFSFTLAEIVFARIEKLWDVPDRIISNDNEVPWEEE